jgi:signal transduction histidine kinase
MHRFVGFGSSFCNFASRGPPPHLVDISAVDLLADMLEARVADKLTEVSAFLCITLLRLARMNVSWIAARPIVSSRQLTDKDRAAFTKLGKVLLVYMERPGDEPSAAASAAIRNEAACGYGAGAENAVFEPFYTKKMDHFTKTGSGQTQGDHSKHGRFLAGIAVFLNDPLERASVASQLLRQDPGADWHKNLVALVLTNLSSAPVLQQIMPATSMTDKDRASSADSLFELVDAALGVISAEQSSWKEPTDVPTGAETSFLCPFRTENRTFTKTNSGQT